LQQFDAAYHCNSSTLTAETYVIFLQQICKALRWTDGSSI